MLRRRVRSALWKQETWWSAITYRELTNLTPNKTSALPVMKSR
jgi:hypothetical protein